MTISATPLYQLTCSICNNSWQGTDPNSTCPFCHYMVPFSSVVENDLPFLSIIAIYGTTYELELTESGFEALKLGNKFPHKDIQIRISANENGTADYLFYAQGKILFGSRSDDYGKTVPISQLKESLIKEFEQLFGNMNRIVIEAVLINPEI
jgi:hypothetical protein